MNPLTDFITGTAYERSQKQDRSGAIHPSDLCECLRIGWYRFNGYPGKPHDDFIKVKFFQGFRIQEWMNEALENQGLLIASNIPVETKIHGVLVRGEADYIIKWPLEHPDGWCILDTKSVEDNAFRYGSFPYPHHTLQVGAYSWALRMMMVTASDDKAIFSIVKSHTLTKALCELADGHYGEEYPPQLAYIGRGKLEEQWFSAGENAAALALEKLEELADFIKTNVIPPRPWDAPDEHPWRCTKASKTGVRWPSCDYYHRCWDDLRCWHDLAKAMQEED